MSKRHNQRNILRYMDKLETQSPLMSDSRMAFVSWLVSQFNEGVYEDHKGSEKIKEKQVRQSLYHLEKKKFIKKTILKSGKIIFELTKSGKTNSRVQEINDLEFVLPVKWDKKWRFVMFDLPEKFNYRRDIFRNKLKQVGFFLAQQSVWVFPYDCGVEMDNLLEFLDIQEYVLQFTGEVKHDRELKEYFKKQGFKL